MPITNRDRFPDVNFLPDANIKKIGTVGNTDLVIVGKEKGTDAPVVSSSYTDNPAQEELFAVPLYELMSHSQDAITIDKII